jgi:hypothetical protein
MAVEIMSARTLLSLNMPHGANLSWRNDLSPWRGYVKGIVRSAWSPCAFGAVAARRPTGKINEMKLRETFKDYRLSTS